MAADTPTATQGACVAWVELVIFTLLVYCVALAAQDGGAPPAVLAAAAGGLAASAGASGLVIALLQTGFAAAPERRLLRLRFAPLAVLLQLIQAALHVALATLSVVAVLALVAWQATHERAHAHFTLLFAGRVQRQTMDALTKTAVVGSLALCATALLLVWTCFVSLRAQLGDLSAARAHLVGLAQMVCGLLFHAQHALHDVAVRACGTASGPCMLSDMPPQPRSWASLQETLVVIAALFVLDMLAHRAYTAAAAGRSWAWLAALGVSRGALAASAAYFVFWGDEPMPALRNYNIAALVALITALALEFSGALARRRALLATTAPAPAPAPAPTRPRVTSASVSLGTVQPTRLFVRRAARPGAKSGGKDA